MSDRLAQVLAHPLRDRILFEYQGTPACASEVAHRVGRPLNVVSYHTRVLVRHGCLELVRTERRRGALARYYRATVTQLIEDEAWADLTVARRRHLALDTLARVATEARHVALAGGFDGAGWHLSRSPVELDEQGVIAASRLLRRTLDEVTDIAAHARRRGGRRGEYVVEILGFRPGR